MLASPVTIQARQILDIVYPVGMVLMFNDGTDPNNIMHGQTWTKLPGGYALTTTNNTNGGDASATDAQNHMPGYSYQGGLPNITGRYDERATQNADTYANAVGALSYKHNGSGTKWETAHQTGSTSKYLSRISFDASKSSDRYGTYQGSKVSVVADHYAVVAWKRTG